MNIDHNTAKQFVQQAHQALREGDREAARRLAQQAAQLSPDLEEPWLILAAISNAEESVECLRRALQINPNSLRAREGMHWAVQRLRRQQIFVQPLGSPTKPLIEDQELTELSINGTESDTKELPFYHTGSEKLLLPPISTFRRVFKYAVVKAITLFLTVAVGLYLFILILNLGGLVDKIFSATIDESIGAMLFGGWLDDTPEPERSQIIEQTRWQMQEAQGLHKPFAVRSFLWFINGITLQLGEGVAYYFRYTRDGPIREIILQRLPYTLILAGVTNVFVFFASILTALVLSRRPGNLLDRLFFFLSPLTSVPSWILGIILVAIFAAWLRILPFPRLMPIDQLDYSLRGFASIGKQMILPMMAIFIGAFFQGVYSWRTFFLINAGEDYVDMARAIGLPRNVIERRYILRPVLPYIITSFATLMLLVWQGSMALELLFYWPGIGLLFLNSVRNFSTPMSLGIVVVFAYILAITVFLLDIMYALVDPRVRLGSEGYSVRPIRQRRKWWRRQQNTGVVRQEWVVPGSDKTSENTVGRNFGRSLLKLPGSIYHWYQGIKPMLRELFHFRHTQLGFVLIVALITVAIYTVISIPYHKAIVLWRSNTDYFSGTDWYQNPEFAPPAWINIFRSKKLPETIVMDSMEGDVKKVNRPISETSQEIKLPFQFEFTADAYPQDIILYISSEYLEKPPFITLIWHTPDGKKIDLGGHKVTSFESYYLSRDDRLERKFRDKSILEGLFGDPNTVTPIPQKGQFALEVIATTFESDSDVDVEMVVYGMVHGLAGTDNARRDLSLALLWGLPVALVFGLLGTFFTSLLAITIAAIGVWYSGWVDELIQHVTEMSMILPALPIVILVYLLVSKSIWVTLGVVVLINTFSSGIKNYRAAFLQIKNAPYIEAARAYGSSNRRLILKFMMPYIMPVLVPQIVIMIPVFVFFESTLAFLGVSDPYIPTWGKIIYDALIIGDLSRQTYWFLEPVALLMLTALAFSLFGMGLERVLNPKLRME